MRRKNNDVGRWAEVKSARCIINVAGPYMLTQGELMTLWKNEWKKCLNEVISGCFFDGDPPT